MNQHAQNMPWRPRGRSVPIEWPARLTRGYLRKPRTFTDQHKSAGARRRNSLIEKRPPETPDSGVFPLHGPASANEG
jgi:hypothetical protein